MTEPVITGGSIAAVINFIVWFVLKEELDPGVQAAIASSATVIVGLVTRSKVSPV